MAPDISANVSPAEKFLVQTANFSFRDSDTMAKKSANTAAKLTVIITTSPTPSGPSASLIMAVLKSYNSYCRALLDCNLIVVFDGYDTIVPKAQLKKGRVTQELADFYDYYKCNVQEFLLTEFYGIASMAVEFTETQAEAEYGGKFHQHGVPYTITQTHDKRLTFITASRQLGFGLAVRSALRVTETPYVFVQQHDWVLASLLPIRPLLQVMEESETKSIPIKYVCLPAVRMLSYATSMDVEAFPALRTLTSSLKGEYAPESGPLSDKRVPLTPLFFWHDKPHIASTAHYLARVFPSRLAMLRGDFIEDKIGQRARAQMKEGLVSSRIFLCAQKSTDQVLQWEKWATWLYYPDDGKQLCLRHLKGRTWEGEEREAEKVEQYKQLNLEAAGEKSPATPGCVSEEEACDTNG